MKHYSSQKRHTTRYFKKHFPTIGNLLPLTHTIFDWS